jgi:REP-associated tyrosine transposase
VLPGRKSIRLPRTHYVGRNIYFLTFCCQGRRPVFRDDLRASSIVGAIKEVAESTSFLVHAYCVMPDHIHVVAEGARDDSDLERFAKTFKQLTAFRYKQVTGERMWQKRFYDHILRATDSLDTVAWYVWLNPVRAGLCADARSYQYSGSLTVDWNGKAQSEKRWVPAWKGGGKDLGKERTT